MRIMVCTTNLFIDIKYHIVYNIMKIGIIGLGFVGGAIYKSFSMKGVNIVGYDKHKDGGIGHLHDCFDTDYVFLALPTPFCEKNMSFDKSALEHVCHRLEKHNYRGCIVIKSTVEPETTEKLSLCYPDLHFIHNPEFLTARTAFEDFHNQKHIVIGSSNKCPAHCTTGLHKFYEKYYPDAEITSCSALESESMKMFVNSFYAVKVQFFNEIYLLCQKNGCDYEKVKYMMLKNGWINPMHTSVPGPDGQLSYGGACLPKDTQALYHYMDEVGTFNNVLEATINERNKMRCD
jgi:UDPglucose 6-dehydrogenase